MKKLAMALLTMMATGCTVNGRSMFGTGPATPANAPASRPAAESGTEAPRTAEADAPAPPPSAPPTNTGTRHDPDTVRSQLQSFVRYLDAIIALNNDPEVRYDPSWHHMCSTTYNILMDHGVSPSTVVTSKGQTNTIQWFEQHLCREALVEQEKLRDPAYLKAAQERRDRERRGR